MRILYTCSIYLYYLAIRIASLFNEKAGKWIRGRKGIIKKISKEIGRQDARVIWFHCASLGEFEMGRPVMERIKEKYPEYQLLVSFFSPSGYEVRKDHPLADYTCYLPTDMRCHAKQFIDAVHPVAAVFIKYEFWFNYIYMLKQEGIPVFSISAVFRNDQLFFTWYGAWFRKHLRMFNWIYTQTEASKQLVQQIGIENVSVSGDTRFDRVVETVSNAEELPMIQEFAGNSHVFVAGSSWHPDEDIYLKTCVDNSDQIKLIIAPHDVSEHRISSIEKKINKPTVRYSHLKKGMKITENILIIDSIGLLARIYRYATLAFIGGAFGAGLHNILEAVAFGCPVFFGPKHDKFWEASALIDEGGAFEVKDENNFAALFDKLIHDPGYYQQCSEICRRFIKKNTGGSDLIVEGMVNSIQP